MMPTNTGPSRATLPAVVDDKNWRSLPVPDRIAAIENIFLYHPEVSRALQRLEHMFHAGRGMGVLMHGPDKVGIGSLIKRFAQTHPARERKPIALQPVIVSTPTSKLSAAGLAESISCDAGWPPFFGASSKIPELQIDNLFRRSETRMLFLLRASLLANGRTTIAPESIPFIINILDRAAVTFILAGRENLPDLVMKCPDLRDAFFQDMPVAPLPMDEHWLAMIGTLATELPFEETELTKDDMPERLHNASEGKTPDLMPLVKTASTVAYYEDRSPVLRVEHFKRAFSYIRRPSRTDNPFDAGVAAQSFHVRKSQTAENTKRDVNRDALRIANRDSRRARFENLM
ncbi:TniB family NTP-binding protein [Bradyrhizobium sp. 200]|uniref:TniB family NTP-binding protein n=1 Tax=Bradyrhizobium sp. 200 TaxID=2782665 RepID=UPI001FFF6936|nr:TniB family NTP-binding protein [Bradyrhizobium sp. 200]UPJ53416.1 TniB family NTP-binding protein [Bradyrhizobium sp. 200]